MMQTIKVRGKRRGTDLLDVSTGLGGAGKAVTGQGGSKTVYLDEEVSSFTRVINKELKDIDDPEIKKRLPIDPDTDDLFNSMFDGIIGLYLLKKYDDDLIDLRTVNKGSNLNIYKTRENLNYFFAACSGIIRVIGIDAQTFLDRTPHLMLAIIWQIVRLLSVKDINLRDCNQIYLLLKDGEDVADLLKLPAEEILKRWMNYHLAKAGQEPINNLGKDLADSTKLLYVLNQVAPADCPLDAGLAEQDLTERAGIMIANSKNIKP